ncbi:MAG: hypothetical protein M1544_00670 [Candidatus Marsarchaeota archaeon]|nr:hypothetical protein [Candidatus Marsarchaeota archaeon]MCL5101857.1 hypothetical protein [Candidatus Marsarchaeota archaeon]
MYKSISDFEVDSKGRFVIQIPLKASTNSDYEDARKIANDAVRKTLNGVPRATISISNNPSDPKSLVRVEKYGFTVLGEAAGRVSLLMRALCEDPYSVEEKGEFALVAENVRKALGANGFLA